MRKIFTEAQLRAELARRAAQTTQRDLARALGVDPSIMCDVLKGRRDPGPKLLKALGMRKVVSYVQQ